MARKPEPVAPPPAPPSVVVKDAQEKVVKAPEPSEVKSGSSLEVVKTSPGKVIASDGRSEIKVIWPSNIALPETGVKIQARLVRDDKGNVNKGYLVPA